MKYGVLGTGNVAHRIATKLIALGHEVMMGSRTTPNDKALQWASQQGKNAQYGTLAETAAFGECVFNCIKGIYALDALAKAGITNLEGKILVDQSNPYLYQNGHISLDPRYTGNTSLGEKIQQFLPHTFVVKTLNYIDNSLMTHPGKLSEPVTGFYCGNNLQAKVSVKQLLLDFGWTDTLDLGDISMSRYTEMLGAFWVPVFGQLHSMQWGLKLVR